jgi:cation diffusion facilitator family transporter
MAEMKSNPKPVSLTRFAWLSIMAALLTMGLKTLAWWLTGSIGLLSDAAESGVNLVAAIFSLCMLGFAAQPADEGHPFGHGKAEYFASGFEGVLILFAAGGIAWLAVDRWLHPVELHTLDLGLGLSVLASLVNLAVAQILLRAGKHHDSIALEADGHHLMTDVWTTVAILAGLCLYWFSGIAAVDPAIALLAALHISGSGISLIRRSISGLLDRTLPAHELARIEAIFEQYRSLGMDFHDLRTRQAGSHRLITVHLLVPGEYTVKQGHDVAERIESDIRALFRASTIITHLEPLEDTASFEHERIDMPPLPSPPLSPPSPRHQQTNPARNRLALPGLILLVGGGAGSMLTQGLWLDISLGGGLIGLILMLADRKRELRRVKEE